MLWKENKYHRRLQSAPRLQCTKLISLCYLPKVLPFFISNVQPPQWGNMKERADCYKDAVVFAIYVNLTCFSVFTERSIPKLQGPTLSKMNNLFIITLNLLSCYNCLCNPLTDFFLTAWLDIKVVLLVYFIATKKKKKKWLWPSAVARLGEEACNAFVCEALMSSNPGLKWLWRLIFKHFKWIQSSHRLAFLAPYLALSNSLAAPVRLAAQHHSTVSRTV